MRPYLLALLLAAAAGPAWAATPTETDALARRLLNSQGCKGCHRLDGEGASLASDLSKVGARLDREQLRHLMVNPQHRHARGRIADFAHLQAAEIDALVTFLSQRR
jgi:mono/diheme cytochrome c family protein